MPTYRITMTSPYEWWLVASERIKQNVVSATEHNYIYITCRNQCEFNVTLVFMQKKKIGEHFLASQLYQNKEGERKRKGDIWFCKKHVTTNTEYQCWRDITFTLRLYSWNKVWNMTHFTEAAEIGFTSIDEILTTFPDSFSVAPLCYSFLFWTSALIVIIIFSTGTVE